jgi:hypothetical protein
MISLAALTVPALLTNASALLLLGATNRHSANPTSLLAISMLVLQVAAAAFGITTGLMLLGFQAAADFGAGLGTTSLSAGVLMLSLESLIAALARIQSARRNTSAK